MDNLFFQDTNQSFSVNLIKEVYKQMIHYCTISNSYETGGILIGDYSSNQITANVLQATPPPKDSRYAKYNFWRGCNGLQRTLDTAWKSGQYYLGEWHYHPNAPAVPSYADISQMFTLSKDKKLKCPEPILIIIGGSSSNWEISINVFTKNGQTALDCVK
jgi:integrative and conjugative element protein (TIGR02256 family)